jgi:hypothetical protein
MRESLRTNYYRIYKQISSIRLTKESFISTLRYVFI